MEEQPNARTCFMCDLDNRGDLSDEEILERRPALSLDRAGRC